MHSGVIQLGRDRGAGCNGLNTPFADCWGFVCPLSEFYVSLPVERLEETAPASTFG